MMKRNERTRGRLSATALAVGAAALTAAAFAAFSLAQGEGSGNGPSGGEGQVLQAPAPGPPGFAPFGEPSAKDREAFEAFEACMREHGVEPPSPEERPDGPPSEQELDRIREAHEACAGELPEGARALPLPPPPCHDHGVSEGREGDGERS
jgi:hypothetical protein